MFESVLIANRGEIARRVVRTLRRLGIRSVAVYTALDGDAPHVREADDALAIGSYLDVEAVIEAARRAGASALHPGYGFLSERPELARACDEAGIVFVGPPAEAMEAMGDKIAAKEVAERAGVPTVPSYTLDEVRFPVLVKAAAGGGGRGMRMVERREDLEAAMAAARREAKAGFGDETVFLERYLPRARHIEVQVIADTHGTVRSLGERECSLQRRHQKVIEEAPSPVVDHALRQRLGDEATALAAAVGYAGAGTVEFIADFEDPSEHYFLEMNARLQVEHPVTELVTGLDLVELQLLVASGAALPDFELRMEGHAIEARVNAEDAEAGFLPASGTVLAYRRPAGARVDDAIDAGSVVGTDYDSLIAKVIAHAADRATALARLDRALADTVVLGVTTNTGFLRALINHPAVRDGALDTRFIEREQPAAAPVAAEAVARAAATVHMAVLAEHASDDPFTRVDGWRLAGARAPSFWRLAVDGGEPLEVRLMPGADIVRSGRNSFAITTAGERVEWAYAYEGDHMWVGHGGRAWRVRQASTEEAHEAQVHGDLRAPMPGSVLLVPASVGDSVRTGDPVIVLESMKMELTITAPVDGEVKEITVAVGDQVARDQSLARVE
jgi:acetyl-CoA/propionyl-CoA carboxylase, biotin carboxylase, biotin carboxyl carrier protein